MGGPAAVLDNILTKAQQPSPQIHCFTTFITSKGSSATTVLHVTYIHLFLPTTALTNFPLVFNFM